MSVTEENLGAVEPAETDRHQARRAHDKVVIDARDVVVEYKGRGRTVLAVDRVNLQLHRGETLGLVGESGSGKSSLGRAIAQLPSPTSGAVGFDGTNLVTMSRPELRVQRRRIQMVFQDPISSLNPRRTAVDIVAEPLRLRGERNARAKALEMLAQVGVNEQMAERKPHQLSGGQCQRISIARAFIQNPEVLICDEPVSALDVSVQAQVLNILESMKDEFNLAMIFISHDLAVVSNVSDRVAVLYRGRLCEVSPSQDLYREPRHPYTKLLLDSVPDPDVSTDVSRDEVASSARPSTEASVVGCRFANRCPFATEICREVTPELELIGPDHLVACHHPLAEREPAGRALDTAVHG